jgi:hypothetical protein
VKSHANGRMARENFDEGKIAARVGAFEHVVEIPDRLVRVNQEHELEFPQRMTLSSSTTA